MYLSKRGITTLMNSTLSDLLTYFYLCSLCRLVWLIKLRRFFDFFFGGGIGEESKFHLFKWNKVCSSISWGGLEIRNLRIFYKGLLGKWLCLYHQEVESLWRAISVLKYGSLWRCWCSTEVRTAHDVGLWKNIINGWEVFAHFISFMIREGSGV